MESFCFAQGALWLYSGLPWRQSTNIVVQISRKLLDYQISFVEKPIEKFSFCDWSQTVKDNKPRSSVSPVKI